MAMSNNQRVPPHSKSLGREAPRKLVVRMKIMEDAVGDINGTFPISKALKAQGKSSIKAQWWRLEDFCCCVKGYPLVMTIENCPLIVDFPVNMVMFHIFHSYVSLPEGKSEVKSRYNISIFSPGLQFSDSTDDEAKVGKSKMGNPVPPHDKLDVSHMEVGEMVSDSKCLTSS